MSHNIIVESGKAFRLLTSGKYCDQDIIITAEGGKEDLDVVLTEQDNLIDELREVLKSKGSGEAEPAIEPLEVTENGTYDAPAGVDGYSPVTVNVPVPDGYIIPSGSKSITENGTHDVTEFAAVEVNVEGSGGGGDELLNALVEGSGVAGTITATKIRDYAFRGVTFGGDVYFPNAESIGSYAFQLAREGGVLVAPNVTTIGAQAFKEARFTRVEFPKCTSVGNNAFDDDTSSCTLLEAVFPALLSVPNYCFMEQTKLREVDLSSVTQIGTQSFRYCRSLKILDLPSLEKISGSYAFSNTNTDLPGMRALVLRKEAVCTLSSSDNFASSHFADGTAFIYVPAALKSQYEQASNWSTYAAQFRALEDYTVDGTITGALDETKI